MLLTRTQRAVNWSPKTSAVLSYRELSVGMEHLKSIFECAVASVEPQRLVREAVRVHQGHLLVAGKSYALDRPCYAVGFGKAVLGMAIALEEILGTNLKEGICNVPVGIFKSLVNYKIKDNSRFKFIEGARDNLPDADAMQGAIQIQNLVQKLTKEDLLIVLISGGGSALLPLPKAGVSLEEKQGLIKMLANKGADITELNSLRKQISELKGGGLAALSYPAQVVSLIISDVIGDPLDFIASGPTQPNANPPEIALDIIRKYELANQIPPSILNTLSTSSRHHTQDMIKETGDFKHVYNVLIGNNAKAVSAVSDKAKSLGYVPLILSTAVKGDVAAIARTYALFANQAIAFVRTQRISDDNFKIVLLELSRKLGANDGLIAKLQDSTLLDVGKGLCFIAGGELTVTVKGKGLGGRNQQLALAFSLEMHRLNPEADVQFLSCGTDGIDGPTDAAGGIGCSNIVTESSQENIDPIEYLNDNNCYEFFSKYQNGKYLIKTGHTGTNVMDIHIMILNSNINSASNNE